LKYLETRSAYIQVSEESIRCVGAFSRWSLEFFHHTRNSRSEDPTQLVPMVEAKHHLSVGDSVRLARNGNRLIRRKNETTQEDGFTRFHTRLKRRRINWHEVAEAAN
jgi:hypothetical protein